MLPLNPQTARLSVAFYAFVLVGCTGRLNANAPDSGFRDIGATDVVQTSDSPIIDGSTADGPARDTPAPDATVDTGVRPFDGGPSFDAGPCSASGIAANLSVTPIRELPGGVVFAAATATGLVLAVQQGELRLVFVDFEGNVGESIAVDGSRFWGLTHGGDGTGVLVDRASDELWAVVFEDGGALRFEQRLLGGVPHDITNNEWFGDSIRAGRMTWTGTHWATYHTVQRLWPDGIAHYGDTLRLLDGTTGEQTSGGWGWGCSHSMEVAITQNASGLGPACVSDCFPGKGVYFQHRTELFEDPSGNCSGRVDTQLGGIAAASDGFWVAYATPHTRMSRDVAIQHVGDDRSVGEVHWMTANSTPNSDVRIAPYGAHTLVGWSGDGDRLVRVDGSGSAVEGPIMAPDAHLFASTDFVALPGGDVAWVSQTGEGSSIMRLRACF